MVKVRGEKSNDVELFLKDDGEGTVTLHAVNPTDPNYPWYIAEITKDGILLCGDLPSNFGIATDEDGEVIIK